MIFMVAWSKPASHHRKLTLPELSLNEWEKPGSKMRKPMIPTPFNPETDFPPIPFDERHCRAALQLKEAACLAPHVGCFVWTGGWIEVPSPSRRGFISSWTSAISSAFWKHRGCRQKLVWLPTWHQAAKSARNLESKIRSYPIFFQGPQSPGQAKICWLYTGEFWRICALIPPGFLGIHFP